MSHSDFIARLADMRARVAGHEHLQDFRTASEKAAAVRAEIDDLVKRLEAAEQEAARLRKRLAELAQTSEALKARMKTDLARLGYDGETLAVLHLFPLLFVAWADGELSSDEAREIRKAAAARGIVAGTPAGDQLEGWLKKPPSDEHAATLLEITGDLLLSTPEAEREKEVANLRAYVFRVAEASRELLGRGPRISADEQDAIVAVARMIEGAHENASGRLRRAVEKP
jgi:hypothetical protein